MNMHLKENLDNQNNEKEKVDHRETYFGNRDESQKRTAKLRSVDVDLLTAIQVLSSRGTSTAA